MRQPPPSFISHSIPLHHSPPLFHHFFSPIRPPFITPQCTHPAPHRRVRVPRKCTSTTPGWQWPGASSNPTSAPTSWLALFHVNDRVLKTLESKWTHRFKKGLTKGFATFTALGARVLRSLTHFINRSLYPDTEAELVVEFGIAEPCPHDKNFVDPLREWELSNVTYYRDSFGRRVYLQLEGASGMVTAGDYRDHFDEVDEEGRDDERGNAGDSAEGPGLSILSSHDDVDLVHDHHSFFADGTDCWSRS